MDNPGIDSGSDNYQHRLEVAQRERLIWSNEVRILQREYAELCHASQELLTALESAEQLMDLIGYANRLRDVLRKQECRS